MKKVKMYCNVFNAAILLLNVQYVLCASYSAARPNFIYNRFKYGALNTITVNSTMEQILDFYEDSDKWRGFPTRVHVSSNSSIDSDHPLFVTATQQKGVSSWELPLEIQTTDKTLQFKNMARTLCPHDAGLNVTSSNRPTLQLTTSETTNVSVTIQLKRVEDFYVELDKEVSLNVTPSSPKYYYFSFDNNPWNVSGNLANANYVPSFNYSIPKSVMVIIESDDYLCAVISIQNNSCPVFDNEEQILYRGYRLTMTKKGGITLTQSMFPQGFYVVFIVKEKDDVCTGVSETGNAADLNRLKSFRFHIKAAITLEQYLIGASVFLALTLTFAALAVSLSYCTCKWREEVVSVEVGPETSRSYAPIEDRPLTNDSDSEPDTPTIEAAIDPRPLTVATLSKTTPSVLYKRSDRYFWGSLTIAVIYALPVFQLLVTYQHMIFSTGNEDLCYYNFLCAHPFAGLADANHVYSNVAYLVLGAGFMLQVLARQRAERGDPQCGIALNAPLYHAMGLALVMEGVLSACYHLCPNKMNFQFDSSFMYAISLLVSAALYHKRHPDAGARAHCTFLLLAAVMAVGVYGIMYPSIYFWVAFTLLHLASCFLLTLKIYYVGRHKLGIQIVRSAWSNLRVHRSAALVPDYTARAVLLAIANVLNWLLAGYGLYEHTSDFARHLLAILMGNTVLYMLFYICMKLVHRERLSPPTVLYLVLSMLCWAAAAYCFTDSRTKWSKTPAQSRTYNAECSALQFLDTHDLWHGASAAALFLTYNLLLSVDDPLRDTPTHLIRAF